MRAANDKFSMNGLQELYHERGRYEFKVVMNPDIFDGKSSADVKMVAPSGEQMPVTVRRWGRKIMCEFQIDDTVQNGVGLVIVEAVADDGNVAKEVFSFWSIAMK